MNYKLNVADEDGIFLGYVLVSVDSENTEAYNITKPMARSAVMMDIEELIEDYEKYDLHNLDNR